MKKLLFILLLLPLFAHSQVGEQKDFYWANQQVKLLYDSSGNATNDSIVVWDPITKTIKQINAGSIVSLPPSLKQVTAVGAFTPTTMHISNTGTYTMVDIGKTTNKGFINVRDTVNGNEFDISPDQWLFYNGSSFNTTTIKAQNPSTARVQVLRNVSDTFAYSNEVKAALNSANLSIDSLATVINGINTIYSGDGIIATNRYINAQDNDIEFDSTGDYTVNSLSSQTYVAPNILSIVGHDGSDDTWEVNNNGTADFSIDTSLLQFHLNDTTKQFALTTTGFGIGTSVPDSELTVIGGLDFKNGTQGLGKVLTSDANGGASWEAPESGAAGNDKDIQFNSSNLLSANDNFIWDGANVGLLNGTSIYATGSSGAEILLSPTPFFGSATSATMSIYDTTTNSAVFPNMAGFYANVMYINHYGDASGSPALFDTIYYPHPSSTGGLHDTIATLFDIRADVLPGSGTVTNIATGYGLTGGPITTTGTVKVDTSSIVTQTALLDSILAHANNSSSWNLTATNTGAGRIIGTSSNNGMAYYTHGTGYEYVDSQQYVKFGPLSQTNQGFRTFSFMTAIGDDGGADFGSAATNQSCALSMYTDNNFSDRLIVRHYASGNSGGSGHPYGGSGVDIANISAIQPTETGTVGRIYTVTSGGFTGDLVANDIGFAEYPTGVYIDQQQNITNTNPASPSAVLQINDTTQGVLIPRTNTRQMNAITSPAPGLLVENSDIKRLEHFNGAAWIPYNDSLSTLSNSYSATGTATTSFTVTLGVTEPNNTYEVFITPTSLLGTTSYYVSAKTTTTFTVTYVTGLTGTLTFDWMAKE